MGTGSKRWGWMWAPRGAAGWEEGVKPSFTQVLQGLETLGSGEEEKLWVELVPWLGAMGHSLTWSHPHLGPSPSCSSL